VLAGAAAGRYVKKYPLLAVAAVLAFANRSSTRHAEAAVAMAQGAAPPSDTRVGLNPWLEYAVKYDTSAVLMLRSELTPEASFAAILERMKFGIAIAAMIKIIATTINNSIREKPFCLFMTSKLLNLCSEHEVYLLSFMSLGTPVKIASALSAETLKSGFRQETGRKKRGVLRPPSLFGKDLQALYEIGELVTVAAPLIA
jgi:hypothetical protein